MAKLKNSPVKQSGFDPQASLSFSFKTKSQVAKLGRIEKKAPNYQGMVQRIPYEMGKGSPMTYVRRPSVFREANQPASKKK